MFITAHSGEIVDRETILRHNALGHYQAIHPGDVGAVGPVRARRGRQVTLKPVYFPTAGEFRAWLEAHHATHDALLVGFHKRHSGRLGMTWPDSVDEALCFGWIDGVRRAIDADREHSIGFSPRRSRSRWSLIKRRGARRRTLPAWSEPSGRRRSVHRARRRGTYSYEQRRIAQLDADAEQRFRRARRAWAFFESQPPGYRRTAIFWVMSAKRDATRASRLATLIRDSADGLKIGPLRRP